jgi:choline dehydrogenase-like flavoprotein
VSGTLGGFSTVWGAQIMPFSRATFDRWPFGWDEIEPHYRAVLAEVPLAGEDDDYAEDFRLLSACAPLPPASARRGTGDPARAHALRGGPALCALLGPGADQHDLENASKVGQT